MGQNGAQKHQNRSKKGLFLPKIKVGRYLNGTTRFFNALKNQNCLTGRQFSKILPLDPLLFPLEVTDLKVMVRYKNLVKSNAFKVKRYFQSVTSNDPLLFAHLCLYLTLHIPIDGYLPAGQPRQDTLLHYQVLLPYLTHTYRWVPTCWPAQTGYPALLPGTYTLPYTYLQMGTYLLASPDRIPCSATRYL